MFGKWIVLEGISTPCKSMVTRRIIKSYPGCIQHITLDLSKDLVSNLENILKIKEKISSLLLENISVICNSWISSSLAMASQPKSDHEMRLVNEILKSSRPDLSVALVSLGSEYERKLLGSEHIDLVLLSDKDDDGISRLVLNHLLHHDF